MLPYKYICVTGYVVSKDGDHHRVSCFDLPRLYGVDRKDCVFVEYENGVIPCNLGDIVLYPDSTGKYELPKVQEEKEELDDDLLVLKKIGSLILDADGDLYMEGFGIDNYLVTVKIPISLYHRLMKIVREVKDKPDELT